LTVNSVISGQTKNLGCLQLLRDKGNPKTTKQQSITSLTLNFKIN
jgi:hypothetical protein